MHGVAGGLFEARDPAFERRVRESFARQRVMEWLGARLALVEPGRCEIRLPVRAEFGQQHGYVHGGVVGTIADSAAGFAGMSIVPAGCGVLTVEYKMNLLAPADGEELVARGTVIRSGRTLLITQADVAAVKAGRETHCACLLQTLMTLERPE